MNFLEICKKTRQKVGVSGTGPSTVVDQQGSLLRIVDSVIEAWREIQEASEHWKFLVKDGVLNLTEGDQTYSLTTIRNDISLFGSAIPGTLKYGDNTRLTHKDWDQWEVENYDTGAETGRPSLWTVDSDEGLRFYKVPDDDYALMLRYRRRTQILALDADIPCCPEEFHWAIVYRAGLLYAEIDQAPDLINILTPEYRTWMSKLENDQLPRISFAASKFASPRR